MRTWLTLPWLASRAGAPHHLSFDEFNIVRSCVWRFCSNVLPERSLNNEIYAQVNRFILLFLRKHGIA